MVSQELVMSNWQAFYLSNGDYYQHLFLKDIIGMIMNEIQVPQQVLQEPRDVG